ncbi:hypothetical protein PANO111632_00455 [Paracoccus nototheniae]|uniref:Uncharacterized protein n=1 Tax=Paracoccus nototheniae TaxID=2489002 RepID=A0ABW4DYR6_9RHOB|nr:hypothetical protein [Paracoccus nototheniae]
MTRVTIFAAALLSVLAPAAHAAADSFPSNDGSSDRGSIMFVPDRIQIEAGTILKGNELARRNVDASTLIGASVFRGSGMIDGSSAND